MDPTTLSIPETPQLLNSLSYNISPFSHLANIPRQERSLYRGDPVVRKLLDALVFFLHTCPNRGDRFAMTLTVVQDEIVATVAANTPDDIALSDPSSPQVILNTVWRHMLACSGMTPKPVEHTEFATYVLETHLPLLPSYISTACCVSAQILYIKISSRSLFESTFSQTLLLGVSTCQPVLRIGQRQR
ncbi:hypothetical protein QCA50_014686 [Cerrena zonata]|uniref:Uncharacterized protein n=1 Tax=Cerrena zonata TaxID=2478898 RepID=A0AAW0FTB8_9APHY